MSKVISFDGTQIWYEYNKGNGPILVFLHGWVNNWTSWKNEIVYFQEKGFATLYLDLRGHGQSDKPDIENAYLLEYFARDVAVILSKEHITDFVLLGHSMGGMIALTYLNEFGFTGCKGLVLCDTTAQSVLKHTPFENKSPFLEEVIIFLEKRTALRKKQTAQLEDINITQFKKGIERQIFLECLSQTPMVVVLACLNAMMNYDATNILPKIPFPVLVLAGEKDVFLPKIDSLELYEKLGNAEIKILPFGRHFVQITHEKEVETQIELFLEKISH